MEKTPTTLNQPQSIFLPPPADKSSRRSFCLTYHASQNQELSRSELDLTSNPHLELETRNLSRSSPRSKSTLQLSCPISSCHLSSTEPSNLVPTWDPVNLMYVNTPQPEKVTMSQFIVDYGGRTLLE